MKKLVYILSVTVSLFTLSCRQDVNEAKSFPNVATYSPGFAVTGDTVTILGSTLSGASVRVGGETVSLVESSDVFLKFIVSDSFAPEKEDGFYSLVVVFDEFDDHEFAMPIVLNHIVSFEDRQGWLSTAPGAVVGQVLPTGPAQILITDFDGSGVREADATSLFDQTQLFSQIQPTSEALITSSFDMGQENPLGNNFYVMSLEDPSQLGGSGHAGELSIRTEVQNDRVSAWPNSFLEYPNGPFTPLANSTGLRDVYFNFLVYKNGFDKGIIYPYLTNDSRSGGTEFRASYDFSKAGTGPTTVTTASGIGLNEWTWVSIPLRPASGDPDTFKDNFGFGSAISQTTYEGNELTGALGLNRVKFTYAHADKTDDQPVTAEGTVQIYMDHIILTQGAPFYGHKR